MASTRDRASSAVIIATLVAGAGLLIHDAINPSPATAGTITPGIVHVKTETRIPLLPDLSLVPGQEARSTVRVANDGDLPAVITLTAATTDPDGKHLGRALLFSAAPVSGAAECIPTTNATADQTTNVGTEPTKLTGPALDLAPGETASICIEVRLPLDLPNSFQGASTSLSLGTHSTQEH